MCLAINRIGIFIMLVFLSSSCSTKAVKKVPKEEEGLPKAVQQRVLPPVIIQGDKEKEKTSIPQKTMADLYTFTIQNEDLNSAFSKIKSVAEVYTEAGQNPPNFIIDPDINKTVNVLIDKLTMEKVVEVICAQIGLEWDKDKNRNVYYIYKPRLVQKIYRLNEVIPVVTATPSTPPSSQPQAMYPPQAYSQSQSQQSSSSASTSSSGSDFLSDLTKQMDTLINQSNTRQLKSDKESSLQYFTINRQTGLLMVWAYKPTVAHIDRFIDQIQFVKNRQVRIKINIMEVALGEGNKYGINWYRYQQGTTGPNGATGQSRGILNPPIEGILGTVSAPFASNIGKVVTNNPFNLTLDSTQAEALISALAETSRLEVVSSPSIVVQNNTTGQIKITRDRTSIAINESRVPSGTNLITTSSVTTKKYNEGLVVDVTPFIGDDQIITMNLTQTLSDLADLHLEKDSTGATLLNEPEMNERTIKTNLRVPSGKTLLMAGIQRNRLNDSQSGIPFLKDIPLVGWLFKSWEKVMEKTELVMFITPQIIENEDYKEPTEIAKVF